MGSTLVTAGIMGVLLTRVKSHFSPDSAVSLLPFAGSTSAEPSHLAAFLSYFLVSFPQFCPSCLPCTLARSTQVLLGRGQPPLCTEQPVVPVLLSRSVADRLFPSLLQQPLKERGKQMAPCLMNSQQLGEPVCQLGLCSACQSHVCQSWALQLEPLLLLGSHREDEGPLPSLPKLWSLRSAFAQISSSLRAARLSAGPVCMSGLHLV